MISIPPRHLMEVQQWIAQNILRHVAPSSASFAYHPGSSPVLAAEEHCGCAWLLKVDIEDFFHTITEGRISVLFFQLGYPGLLAFELARLTTMLIPSPTLARQPAHRWPAIPYYFSPWEGVLPQGAATSPMLSNLVMRNLDNRLLALSAQYGMRYTRYSDDLAFSCETRRDRAHVERFKRLVLAELSREGFRPNLRKTVIRGPGTRRIVLGMLVNGPTPKLPREFKDMLRLQLHYLTSPKFGPSKHAERLKTSLSTLYHRVRGLIGWAISVEPDYGAECLGSIKSTGRQCSRAGSKNSKPDSILGGAVSIANATALTSGFG
jgi:RNA-directed DNA polymerase